MVMATNRAASPSEEKNTFLIHLPVMTEETLRYLLTDRSGIYVDCTLGAGGHAMAILQALSPGGRFIGIDRDKLSVDDFRRRSGRWSSKIILFHAAYSSLQDLLSSQNIRSVDGVVFDLGLASFQIDDPRRGFSYLQNGPLDMRVDTAQSKTARQVANEYDETSLGSVIRNYGQERRWRQIARAIVQARTSEAIDSTGQLAEIIKKIVPGPAVMKTLARTFQSIRVEVNRELEELQLGLPAAVAALKPGGRLVVICYQSLEDRLVKEVYSRLSGVCQCPRELPKCTCGAKKIIRVMNKRALRPRAQEIVNNPRARSARLRAVEKQHVIFHTE